MEKDCRTLWSLDWTISHLNHGSFGAPSVQALEAQSSFRALMEKSPNHFFFEELDEPYAQAKSALARFLGTKPEHIGFINNATFGMHAVLHSEVSETLCDGDTILFTSATYGAVKNSLHYLAQKKNVVLYEKDIPFSCIGDDYIELLFQNLSGKEKLLVIDHIPSRTGVAVPLEKIIKEAHARNMRVLVDGAHAVGMLPLELDALQADWYVGNCHKWLCPPRTVAFIHTQTPHADKLHPVAVSHSFGRGFPGEFMWTGTQDYTATLAIPETISFFKSLEPKQWRQSTRNLVQEMAKQVADRLSVQYICAGEYATSMQNIPLPVSWPKDPSLQTKYMTRAYREIRKEVLFHFFEDKWWLRLSAHAYSTQEEVDGLGEYILSIAKE